MQLKKWLSLIGVVAVVIGLAGCSKNMDVKVETVSFSQAPVTLTLEGSVSSLTVVNVIPKLSGKIVTTPLVKGQEVQAGEVVAKVDDSIYRRQVQTARYATSAVAAPVTPKVDPAEQAKLANWYNLGAISRVEYDRLMRQAAVAAVPVTAGTGTAALSSSVEAAQAMLANAVIVSPIAGRITAVADNPSLAIAGKVLATIQQISPLGVSVTVPENYIKTLGDAWHKGGLHIDIMNPSGKTEPGRLTYLTTVKDPSTGTFVAKITFTNADKSFSPGELCYVRLSTERQAPQLTVSKKAVQTKDSGDFVYIVNDKGIVDTRAVLTGDTVAGRVVILDGLQAGERVVSDPPASLQIGMKVKTR